MDKEPNENLITHEPNAFVRALNKTVLLSVKMLAVLATIVIFWGVADVIFHLYYQFFITSLGVFNAENLVATLGTFLAVLIAIEVFMNIVLYLRKEVFHLPLVLSTALTAAARKVIVFDYATLSPQYIYATAAVILAIGITYWLITTSQPRDFD